MKPWHRAVAVPLLILLTSAGIAATVRYRPAPAPAKKGIPSKRPLKPRLTPPLRHGGCQGRFWLTEKDLRHPQNYKSYFTRCCYTQQQSQATAIPGSADLGEEDPQAPDLLSGYQRKRRNRPCATS